MSAARERDLAQGGRGRVDEDTNPDLKAMFDVLVPVAWSLLIMGAVSLLAFRKIIRYFQNEDKQEVAQPTFPTGWDIYFLKDEDEEESEEYEDAAEEALLHYYDSAYEEDQSEEEEEEEKNEEPEGQKKYL